MAKAIVSNRRYESVFIFTPSLSSEQVSEAIQKYKDYLAEKKAALLHEYPWGLRDLAYPIQHKSNGFYYLLEYEASPRVIAGLEVEIRRDERVLRALTTVLDKHAIAYNVRQREKAAEEESKAQVEASKEAVSAKEVSEPTQAKQLAVKDATKPTQAKELAVKDATEPAQAKEASEDKKVKPSGETKAPSEKEVVRQADEKVKKDESAPLGDD